MNANDTAHVQPGRVSLTANRADLATPVERDFYRLGEQHLPRAPCQRRAPPSQSSAALTGDGWKDDAHAAVQTAIVNVDGDTQEAQSSWVGFDFQCWWIAIVDLKLIPRLVDHDHNLRFNCLASA